MQHNIQSGKRSKKTHTPFKYSHNPMPVTNPPSYEILRPYDIIYSCSALHCMCNFHPQSKRPCNVSCSSVPKTRFLRPGRSEMNKGPRKWPPQRPLIFAELYIEICWKWRSTFIKNHFIVAAQFSGGYSFVNNLIVKIISKRSRMFALGKKEESNS